MQNPFLQDMILIVASLLLIAVLSWLVYKAKFVATVKKKEEFEGDKIKITTTDDVTIAAEFLDAPGAKYAVILVHMMPTDKKSWRNFAKKLREKGFASIAIDLRGHGLSDDGPKGYRDFSDEEHQKSIIDIMAASDFLVEKEYEQKRQFIVGASVGANLALQFMAENPAIMAGALLSPGLNYCGIKSLPLIHQIKPGRFLLVSASEDDKRNALEAKTMMMEAPKGVGHRTLIYKKAGHGTYMIGKEKPDLEVAIIETFQMMAGIEN